MHRKYHNIPTYIGGQRFDSKREAQYYQDAMLRIRAGLIKDIVRQRPYILMVNGIKICTYRCDFIELDNQGGEHVIDVKGVRTSIYKLKKKLMKAIYGIDIEER